MARHLGCWPGACQTFPSEQPWLDAGILVPLSTHLLPLKSLTAGAAQPLAMHRLQLHSGKSTPRCPHTICGDGGGQGVVVAPDVLCFMATLLLNRLYADFSAREIWEVVIQCLWVGRHYVPTKHLRAGSGGGPV